MQFHVEKWENGKESMDAQSSKSPRRTLCYIFLFYSAFYSSLPHRWIGGPNVTVTNVYGGNVQKVLSVGGTIKATRRAACKSLVYPPLYYICDRYMSLCYCAQILGSHARSTDKTFEHYLRKSTIESLTPSILGTGKDLSRAPLFGIYLLAPSRSREPNSINR